MGVSGEKYINGMETLARNQTRWKRWIEETRNTKGFTKKKKEAMIIKDDSVNRKLEVRIKPNTI